MREHDSKPAPFLAIPLSSLIRDPFVRAAFIRAERDGGSAMVAPAPNGPVLVGGEAA